MVPGLATLGVNDIIANWKFEQKLGEGSFGACISSIGVSYKQRGLALASTGSVNVKNGRGVDQLSTKRAGKKESF
ncbi:hypothetical protein V3C99_010309 [Haemonchus contortus]